MITLITPERLELPAPPLTVEVENPPVVAPKLPYVNPVT